MFTRPPLWWNQCILQDVPVQKRKGPEIKASLCFDHISLIPGTLPVNKLWIVQSDCVVFYSCLCKRTNNVFLKFHSVLNCLRSTVCVLLCSSSTRDGDTNKDVTIKKQNWNILYNTVVCNCTAVAFCRAQGRLAFAKVCFSSLRENFCLTAQLSVNQEDCNSSRNCHHL